MDPRKLARALTEAPVRESRSSGEPHAGTGTTATVRRAPEQPAAPRCLVRLEPLPRRGGTEWPCFFAHGRKRRSPALPPQQPALSAPGVAKRQRTPALEEVQAHEALPTPALTIREYDDVFV